MFKHIVHFFAGLMPDANDQIMSDWERITQVRREERHTQSREDEARLVAFAQTGELPPAKERIEGLMVPKDIGHTHWIDGLLAHYRLSMEIQADAGQVVFTDRRFFGLKERTKAYPVATLVGADQRGMQRFLGQVRTAFNRRAQRAGLLAVKTRQPKGVVPTTVS